MIQTTKNCRNLIYIKLDQSGTWAGAFSIKGNFAIVSVEHNFGFWWKLISLVCKLLTWIKFLPPTPHNTHKSETNNQVYGPQIGFLRKIKVSREERLQHKTCWGKNLAHYHGCHHVFKGEEIKHDTKGNPALTFISVQKHTKVRAHPQLCSSPGFPLTISAFCLSVPLLLFLHHTGTIWSRDKSTGQWWNMTSGSGLVGFFLAVWLWIFHLTFLRASVASFIKWERHLSFQITVLCFYPGYKG